MIIAFRAPSPLAGLKELPSRILIGRWGRNETGNGQGFTVNETTVEILPRVQHKLSFDRPVLDFEHNTVPTVDKDGKEVPPKEPQKIAATGTPEVVRGEGLFLKDLEWTPEGREHALGGHYPDLSPAVKMNDRGEVLFLHSAGLCRQGSVMDLQLFSAALNTRQLATFSTATATATTQAMDYKKRLLLLLELPETATDEDIMIRLAKLASMNLEAGTTQKFSAQMPDSRELVESEVARQMGNSPESIRKYGTKSRA